MSSGGRAIEGRSSEGVSIGGVGRWRERVGVCATPQAQWEWIRNE